MITRRSFVTTFVLSSLLSACSSKPKKIFLDSPETFYLSILQVAQQRNMIYIDENYVKILTLVMVYPTELIHLAIAAMGDNRIGLKNNTLLGLKDYRDNSAENLVEYAIGVFKLNKTFLQQRFIVGPGRYLVDKYGPDRGVSMTSEVGKRASEVMCLSFAGLDDIVPSFKNISAERLNICYQDPICVMYLQSVNAGLVDKIKLVFQELMGTEFCDNVS